MKVQFMLVITLFVSAPSALAQQAKGQGEQVDVDSIKEKYWAKGNEAELGVVQNRIYSKERRLETAALGGVLFSDPFLSVNNTGFSLGYHFSEYFAIHALYWKYLVRPSSALKTFEETINATTNNNRPSHFMGVEGSASILYGKLSLVGQSIIYYDMHLSAGVGATATESGTNFTPTIGIGQQIYLTKSLSLKVDYRLMRYKETIIEKVITPKLGQVVGERVNYSNSIMLGISFLFNNPL